MSQIKVTQIKSTIGQPDKVRATVKALGLGKMNKSNVLKDNNCTRGMINQVRHLITFEVQ